MPTHDFRCADCGTEFEAERPLTSSDTRVDCPSCGNAHTEKVFGAAAVVFNCGGFYATDHRNQNSKGEARP